MTHEELQKQLKQNDQRLAEQRKQAVYARHGMLPASELKRRGWNDSAIVEFLGPPDLTYQHHRWKRTVRLYRTDRVEAAEASPEFRRHWEQRQGLTPAAELDGLTFTVPRLDWETLLRDACDLHNARKRRPRAEPGGDRATLRKAVVGYLSPRIIPSRTVDFASGTAKLRREYQQLLMAAVVEAYPDLK